MTCDDYHPLGTSFSSLAICCISVLQSIWAYAQYVGSKFMTALYCSRMETTSSLTTSCMCIRVSLGRETVSLRDCSSFEKASTSLRAPCTTSTKPTGCFERVAMPFSDGIQETAMHSGSAMAASKVCLNLCYPRINQSTTPLT